MQWLKKAFAIDPPGPAKPTNKQKAAVDILCNEIIRRHLATPSLLFLETLRPLNFMCSQAMHYFNPFLSVFVNTDGYEHFTAFLEQRGSVDYICRRIEHLEDEREKNKHTKKTDNNDNIDDDDNNINTHKDLPEITTTSINQQQQNPNNRLNDEE